MVKAGVKVGDKVVIGGEEYIFGETSARAYNLWLEIVGKGLSETVFRGKISLRSSTSLDYGMFCPEEIRKALGD